MTTSTTALSDKVHKTRLWIALVPALVVPSLGALIYFVWWSGTPMGQAAMVVTKVFGLIWPIVATLCILRRPVWTRKKINWPVTFGIGIGSGVLIGALMLALTHWTPLGEFIFEAAPMIQQKVVDLGFANNFLLLALLISFFNSAMEEYYWRWFTYGRLREVLKSRFWPHVFAALGFTAHHVIVTLQFFPLPFVVFLCSGIFVGGLIWSWLYERQGHLWGAWISHILADLAIFFIAWQVIS
ncbi:MAG: CPBP family intramembrane glutamic endopeptidase [Verrucomicrobiota bacterium]